MRLESTQRTYARPLLARTASHLVKGTPLGRDAHRPEAAAERNEL